MLGSEEVSRTEASRLERKHTSLLFPVRPIPFSLNLWARCFPRRWSLKPDVSLFKLATWQGRECFRHLQEEALPVKSKVFELAQLDFYTLNVS